MKIGRSVDRNLGETRDLEFSGGWEVGNWGEISEEEGRRQQKEKERRKNTEKEENRDRRKPLHTTKVGAADGRLPGEPGKLAGWEIRDSGVRAKLRFSSTGHFFRRPREKGPKCHYVPFFSGPTLRLYILLLSDNHVARHYAPK